MLVEEIERLNIDLWHARTDNRDLPAGEHDLSPVRPLPSPLPAYSPEPIDGARSSKTHSTVTNGSGGAPPAALYVASAAALPGSVPTHIP